MPDRPVALARFTEQQHGASRENHLADCMFASFEIDGSRVSLPKYDLRAKGLDLQYMVRATLRDLHIHETATTGLGCDHLRDSVIEDVMAVQCGRLNDGKQPGGAGIGAGVGGWGAIERLSLNDCIAVGNATNGIFIELQKGKWPPPRGIKITGGHCIDNRFGISDWGAEGLIVSACVMCENHEVGFDVSAQGVAQVGGRGGLLTDCMIDGNGKDGVSIGNTRGPYLVRGNRISENGRYGYYEHSIKSDDEPARGVTIDANEIWRNGLDGIRIGAAMLDASIVNNRIRDNGRRTEGACSAQGPGVVYGEAAIRGANAHWPEDGHKGKRVLAAGMTAIVASNTAQELSLFPHRPGATSAWQKSPPPAGTAYVLHDAPAARPGIKSIFPLKRHLSVRAHPFTLQAPQEFRMKLSRRIMLKQVVVAAGAVATPWATRSAMAQGKASKQAMKYQDKPNNGQECDTCLQFIPGPSAGANGTCKVVEGPISPKGWCVAYVKKS